MASDKPPPPRGMLAAGLAMLAGAAGGAWMALAHTSVLNLVCGIVLFLCAGLLGVTFLYAWVKGRR
ncbi:hypothetical protein [Amycolatopsis sp. NPDC004625]|uniref:hypothetical protein n=1 Tax=Amycolatopsis sp. NPDC004625 TaxID=3154670 RepID=UPI0033A71B5A